MYKWREKEEELLRILKNGNVLLRGPRQAGKTTLLKHLEEKLNASYYTLDNPRTLSIFENDPDSLVKGKFIFIDEIQESKNAGRILRYLTDEYKRARFVFSGSGAFDIKLNISSYLVGRVHELILLPLSFREFIYWKDKELFKIYDKYRKSFFSFLNKGKTPSFSPLKEIELLFEEYLKYGGYPNIVLSKNKEEQLYSLSKFMIEKDILSFFGIKDKDKLLGVVKELAYRSGKLLDYSSLSVDYRTALNYISILRNSYIIELLSPISTNPSLEIRKSKKILFYDTGFRRAITQIDLGFALEEFSFRQLLPSNYWRDKRKNEVDFILNGAPIEIKKTGKPKRGFYSYIERYSPKRAVVLTLNWEFEMKEKNSTEILFWPIYLL